MKAQTQDERAEEKLKCNNSCRAPRFSATPCLLVFPAMHFRKQLLSAGVLPLCWLNAYRSMKAMRWGGTQQKDTSLRMPKPDFS